ncbi:hypothetical protein ES703_122746 [subsurface metagenome]
MFDKKNGCTKYIAYHVTMVKRGEEDKMFGYPLKDTKLDSDLVFSKNFSHADLQSVKCTYLESETAKGRADRAQQNEFRLTKKRWPEQMRKYAKKRKLDFRNVIDPQKEIIKEMIKDENVAFECFSDNRRYLINDARILGKYDGVVDKIYEQQWIGGLMLKTPFLR